MFDEFAKAIRGSQAAAGVDTGNMYANFYADKTNAAPEQIVGRKSAIDADIEERQRQEAIAAEKARLQAEKQAEDDKNDPGKAQMLMRADRSGYDFYNGKGEKLNINQFSLLTGKRPDELLADSDNPRDQKFVQDYQTMKAMSNAWVNGDKETLQKFREADPQKYNELVTKFKSPQEMVSGFMSYYNDYYGAGAEGASKDKANFAVRPVQAADKNQSARNATATLEQTLAPVTTARPDPGSGIGGWFNKTNPMSGYRDRLKKFEDEARANPWLSYHNALSGR